MYWVSLVFTSLESRAFFVCVLEIESYNNTRVLKKAFIF